MSGWMINIDLPLEQVSALLRGMDGATFIESHQGLSLDFGQARGARATSAFPDVGSDIAVGDITETLPWTIYDFLAERTSAVMWMVDDLTMLVTARGTTPEALGLELVHDRVPPLISTIDAEGNAYEWRAEPNPRSGTLT